MKERDIIKQLHLLQSIKPEQSIVQAIRKQVRSPYAGKENLNFWKKQPNILIFSSVIFAAIVAITVTITLFPDYVGNTIITARIALAVNHYDKAKIALVKVDKELFLFNSSDTNKVISFSHTLAFANMQMSQLRLVGEKGKYTSYQCLELYESYHEDLEKVQSKLGNNTREEDSLLIDVKKYDNAAVAKLKKYNREPAINKGN